MYLDNPGLAKLALLREGVEADARVGEGHGPTPLCPRCATGVRYLDLVLPGDVFVSAPIRDGAPIRLEHRRRRPLLLAGGETMEAEVLPQPALCRQTTRSGLPAPSFANVRGEVLVLRPIPPLERINLRDARVAAPAVAATVDDVLEVVEAALAEGVPPVVRIEAEFLDPEDAGWTRIEPYVRHLRHHFHVLIHLRWVPPRTDRWIDEAYAAGVDAVEFPLEVFDPVIFERAVPGKARLIGHERCLSALEAAARVFPAGAVSSPLLLGIEPATSTADGIEVLADLGVVPTLAPLHPASPFAEGVESYPPLLAALFEATRRAGLPWTWTPSQGDAVAPVEARFGAARSAPLRLAAWRSARSGLGRPVHRALARIRRRLKVIEA